MSPKCGPDLKTDDGPEDYFEIGPRSRYAIGLKFSAKGIDSDSQILGC